LQTRKHTTSTYTSTPENTACNKQTSEKTTTAVLKKNNGNNKKTAVEATTKSQDRTEAKPESHHRHKFPIANSEPALTTHIR